jgi:dTMP kinase
MKKGELYVFEGIDGAGKSSALESVYKILKSQDVDVVTVKNITKSPLGVLLRDIINHKQPYLNDRYIANLFLAELHNVIEDIKQHLQNGTTVLCDRWFYSTIAYLDDKLFGDIAVMAKYDIKPTKTFFINVPVEIANERLIARGDNSIGDAFTTIEKAQQQQKSYYKIMNYYSRHCGTDKHIFVEIDGTQVMSYVVMDIISEIKPELIQEELSIASKKFIRNSHYGVGYLDNQNSRLTAKKEFIKNQSAEEQFKQQYIISCDFDNPYDTYLFNKANSGVITEELLDDLREWCNKSGYSFEYITKIEGV